MRNLIFLFISIILFTGCVSKNSYMELENKSKALTEENISLKARIDELENGEERLVNLAKNSFDDGNFILADNYIKQLKEKHPESKEIAFFKKIQPTIDKKIEEELVKIEKARQDSIKLANINNLGIWEIQYFVDEFGEPTKDGFITTEYPIYGTFSNSATQNSDLRVRFIISGKKTVSIKLFEYNRSNPVKGYKDNYRVLIQDCDGERHTLSASNWDSDRLSFSRYSYNKAKTDAEKMFDILLKGGEIKFKIIDSDRSINEYNFVVSNADWFENALTKMNM